MNKKIALGQLARDKVSGFEGVVYGITTWMNGCRRIGLKSQNLKDGKPLDVEWFDEDDVVVVKKKFDEKGKRTGGPMPDPSSCRSGEGGRR